MWGTVGVLVVALLVLAGCDDGSDGSSSTDRVAGVYLAALRWAVDTDEVAPPSTGDPRNDDLPVVYALNLDGSAVPAAVQVVVVKELRDDLTLRFADARKEAVDDKHEGDPVHDHGMLVQLGSVPEEGQEVTVEADVYRSADDQQTYQLKVRFTGEDWEVVEATPR